ncbi:MarR family winged helix-turn-helix transcriptional regulator [Desulfosporosinus sp. PR]|uniref:MarR family winged helix-turn-helix transcriptional regulator n=1 Tax=Candidatus Desulfosporosinus nitrosoreducens TaxID=3401928 RepID=UPI0027EEE159|nr:MarR family winged helix-turn-helix transcriptional regulator [Desulfosporosinus sp. PR]MDQ7095107.1 MarR family winged helix-turn-helix transcriptional regulator [Desulfosporosinus sp. PR]
MQQAKGKPKSLSPCHCLNIRRASRSVTQFYEKVLEPSKLKITQYSLLRNLEAVGPATMSVLAKIMRIDRTTLNRNMKPLLAAGLITVNPGEDSRSRQVILTEAGRDTLLKTLELWDQAQALLEEYLGREELDSLEQSLAKLEALF